MCQGPIQATPALYSARCDSVHTADEAGWEGWDRTGPPIRLGKVWQDGLSCSCWAAVHGDRQNAAYKGIETDNRWQHGHSGQLGRGRQICQHLVPGLLPADGPQHWAVPEGYSKIQGGRQPQESLQADPSTHQSLDLVGKDQRE